MSITESKPVIDLLGLKNPIKQETENEINKTTEPAETTGSDQSVFNTGGTNAPETGRERDLFPTSRISGEKPTRGQYATETELISESRRLLTVGRITTVDQAAQAALSVSVQAVERFDALVTNKDGKPLAIVGSFKGTINSASVYPAVVAAEAFRIPDAANIYFYHNHPSGTTKLSDADLAITRKLQRVFDGSGITAHGIFAITTNGSFSYENPATREVVYGIAQAGAAAVSVPIIERIIRFDEKMGAGVTSPDISKPLIPKLFDESGLMLLNNQHEPVGFMPMSPGEALPLKHTGMTDSLFRALSMSNAAAILYDSEHHYSVEQYQNIGDFLDEIDVRLLDVVVKQENPNSSSASVIISGAELGWSFRSSTGVFLNDIPSISLVEKSNIKEASQMSSLSKDKKAFHEMVADKLIQQLKEGTAPWQKPWVPGESGAFLPYNPVTGNRYKGINSIYLLSQERDDQRWMTYKQATGLGGQVRKGEKGTGIHYWKFTEEHIKKDDDGKPVLDSEGNPVKEVVRLERPRGFFAIVFNGEQIDGLPQLQKQGHTWDPIERAEGILTASGADIHHNGGSRAFYRPLTDSIHLPDKGQFPSAENYYATALHELGHWTGKEDRLNRDISHPFGSEGYAKEELRAEIASMILGDELGIGHDPGQHAAYVGSWIKVLENDPLEIFRAAADAERIQDYVLGLEYKQVQEQAAQQAQNQTQSENRLATEDVMTPNMADVTAALIPAVVSGIEQAQASVADWNDETTHGVANEKAAEAIELVRQGKFDKALDNLRTAAELEEKHTDSMSHSYEAVANALEAGWRSWQQDKGVGTAITPEMMASFEAIPTDLAQLSHATVADYEKAVQMARLEEERVKTDPNSTAEDITAARELRKTAELDATVNHAAFQRKVIDIEQQQRQPSTHEQVVGEQGQSDKTYLQVPYKEKNQAKELGAKWDRGKQSWYVPVAVDLALFAKWSQAVKATKSAQSESVPAEAPPTDRQFLAVPYTERAIAKGAGALWDKEAKSWYAGPMADMNTLKQWLPENVKLQQAPAMTPREEFADALISLGCIVKGEHPVMDGKTHRIATIGDKSGERSGFYVAYLDGHPAGHIQNNRTGEIMKWKAKGYSLSEEEKAQLQATSAAKLQERDAAQKAQQNTVANSVRELLAVAPLAPAEHPYLQAKQARPGGLRVVPEDSGALPETCHILIGKDWKESKALRESNPDNLVFTAGDLLLAAQDVNGAVRSVQSIQGNGLKRFAVGGAKQDTFHVVGGQGLAALEQSPAIVIGEGYATADTLSQALGFATVAAFDSGNLPNVAKLLHEKFPDKPFIIAGDNDRHQELTEGRNPGKEKAVAAAKAVIGTVLLPIFAPGEQTYPSNLEPVTPAIARSGDLSYAQQEAIAQMKLFTDFNDLATKSALGEGGVERQITNIVNSLVVRHQKKIEIKQQQERVEKLKQQPVQRKAMKI